MSGKTKQWLLLGLVALIWGLIMVRLFDLTSQPEETLSPIRLSAKDLAKTTDEPYRFYLNYPDPFLKTFSFSRIEPDKHPSPPKIESKTIPEVVFKGIVSGARITTAIVTINGRPLMIKRGDFFEGFKVLEVDSGKVRLYFEPMDSTFLVK